jgi:hypothetical protein
MYAKLYGNTVSNDILTYEDRVTSTLTRASVARTTSLARASRMTQYERLRHAAADPDPNKTSFFALLKEMALPMALDMLLKELRFQYAGVTGRTINITRLSPVEMYSTEFPGSMEEFDKFQEMAKKDPSTRDIANEKGQFTLFYPATDRWRTVVKFFLEFLVRAVQDYHVDRGPLNTVKSRVEELRKETARLLKTTA